MRDVYKCYVYVMPNSVATSEVKGDLPISTAAKASRFHIRALRQDLWRATLDTINLVANRFPRISTITGDGSDGHESYTDVRLLVDNWLLDIQRRGARLCGMKQRNGTLYLSFGGKNRFRYSVQIDFDAQRLHVEFERPEWSFVKREVFLLTAVNLHLFAKRICPLPAGQAVIPVRLLLRLSALCRAYQRLVQNSDQALPADTSVKQLAQIQSELCRHLTALELQRTYKRLDFKLNSSDTTPKHTEGPSQTGANVQAADS